MKVQTDKNYHGLGMNENNCKTKKTSFRRYGVKESRNSENIVGKTCYLHRRKASTDHALYTNAISHSMKVWCFDALLVCMVEEYDVFRCVSSHTVTIRCNH